MSFYSTCKVPKAVKGTWNCAHIWSDDTRLLFGCNEVLSAGGNVPGRWQTAKVWKAISCFDAGALWYMRAEEEKTCLDRCRITGPWGVLVSLTSLPLFQQLPKGEKMEGEAAALLWLPQHGVGQEDPRQATRQMMGMDGGIWQNGRSLVQNKP